MQLNYELLAGPIIGFLFTTFTILFIALSAKWMEDREDLTGLDQPPAK
ncbi:MAG: hypothetical protein JWM80_2026 [Cyanobacteria bacterium RYN_339]|nr:hypothetical protein [Cyanobacteria bacterium RYN_339]